MKRRVTVFVDESGRGRPDNRHNPQQPYFIVGALVTDRPQDLRDIVNELCDEENFRRELHWRDFNRTSGRVYAHVAQRLDREAGWEFKATRFRADHIDFRFFGGETREQRPVRREHHAYNFFVKSGIAAALRHSHIARDADEIEIVVDEKARTKEDNFLRYLRWSFSETAPGVRFWTRDCASEHERLIQVADILSGAHNTMLVQASGGTKLRVAGEVWLGRCQHWEYPLKKRYVSP